jgi:hypothetical protein
MNKSRLLVAVCAVLFTFITVSANAALVSRLGGQAAYDTVLDITWTTDASLSGAWRWDNQVGWARGLDTANYLGVDGWRLASMSVAAGAVVNCTGATELACRDNELGYMFYHNLGGSEGDSLSGTQTVGDVTLTNIQFTYWSGTESGFDSAWLFRFGNGTHDIEDKRLQTNAWVVVDGDVFIPTPPAFDTFQGSKTTARINPNGCKNAKLDVPQTQIIYREGFDIVDGPDFPFAGCWVLSGAGFDFDEEEGIGGLYIERKIGKDYTQSLFGSSLADVIDDMGDWLDSQNCGFMTDTQILGCEVTKGRSKFSKSGDRTNVDIRVECEYTTYRDKTKKIEAKIKGKMDRVANDVNPGFDCGMTNGEIFVP